MVDVNGRDKLQILGKVSETIPNPTYVVVPTPGAWTEYYRGNNPEGKSLRELANPIRCPEEFRHPDLRLKLMDEQGVYGCVMFPTTAGLIEEHMKADLEATHAVFHAYNQWLLEDWTFDYEGRIIPTPAITLPDIDLALAELDWCLEHGARTVLIRPAPVPQPDGSSISMGAPTVRPVLATLRGGRHRGDDAQRRLRLRPLRHRLGTRTRRVPGLQPDRVPHVPLRGEPPHLRHARRARCPRRVPTVPGHAPRRRRERRRVGAAARRDLRPRLRQDARPVRRAPLRRPPSARVDQPVPRRRHGAARRRRSAPTACSSAPTSRTRRVSASRSSSNASSPGSPTTTCARS